MIVHWNDRLRRMYAGGHGNDTAKRYARFWAKVFRLGLLPRRWVTLEVLGRNTGTPMRVPLGMADWQGRWYLVSMLGNSNWVRNVREVDGHATLYRGKPRQVQLTEVSIDQRAPILKRYLQTVPGGRPHFPVDRREPVEAFQTIAERYPVFLVDFGST